MYGKRGKGVSLHRTIIGSFIAVCLISSVVAGAVAYMVEHRAVERLARYVRSDMTYRIRNYVDELLSYPIVINRLNGSLMEQGTIDPEAQDSLEELFKTEVEVFPFVSSIHFGNPHGGIVRGGREGSGEMYVMETDGFKAGNLRKIALDDKGGRGDVVSSLPGFDARLRPWFVDGVRAGGPVWSDVYVVFSGCDMALSASYPVYGPGGELLGVMATNLFLSRVSSFLRWLNMSNASVAFVVDRFGRMIASSEPVPILIPSSKERIVSCHSAKSYPNPVVQAAAKAVESSGGWGVIKDIKMIDFKCNGERMFLQVSPLAEDKGFDWFLAVIIPEVDLAPEIIADQSSLFNLALGLLLFALSLALIVSKCIIAPLTLLERAISTMSRDSKVDTVAFPTRFTEVYMLIGTFNRMANRMRLAMDGLKQEIVRREEVEKALTMEATIDFLTGLANRRSFMERLTLEMARISRYGGVGSLLMLDIDRFKSVNDSYGHNAGDQVLSELGKLLAASVREGDLPGRIGGEEFLIFLRDTPIEGAGFFADRVRKSIKDCTVLTDDGPISFTVSVGVTQINKEDGSVDEVIARADRALYRAKELGRDRVEID